jgi:hypothetical protein
MSKWRDFADCNGDRVWIFHLAYLHSEGGFLTSASLKMLQDACCMVVSGRPCKEKWVLFCKSTRTATSLLECFVGIPLLKSGHPNNDRCTDIRISSPRDRLSDRDRVKKLIFGQARISSKTMKDDSKFGDRPSGRNFLIDWWIKMHLKK